MPWRAVEVWEERLQFVRACEESGRGMAALCREFGISRQTGYKWLRRYQEGGARQVVQEVSRKPHSIPRQAPPELIAAVKAARGARPDWGARKLCGQIRQDHPHLTVTISTVHRVMVRQNLIAEEDRRRPAVQRFERQEPNELWQMDFKGPQGFNQGTGPLSILDDFSRYLIALQHVESTNLVTAQNVIRAAFVECGLPQYLLVDHGTPWYNTWSPWGWTELTVWILRQGIRIVHSGVRHPQTQGKVERMHGALQRAITKRRACPTQQSWLDEFRREYNEIRPHEGIGMQTPSTRWRPSPRPFQAEPPDWVYPADYEVRRLAGQGQLHWAARRWEISRALRHERVGLHVHGDLAVIYFCNVPLREINLRTHTNQVLPLNPLNLLHC